MTRKKTELSGRCLQIGARQHVQQGRHIRRFIREGTIFRAASTLTADVAFKDVSTRDPNVVEASAAPALAPASNAPIPKPTQLFNIVFVTSEVCYAGLSACHPVDVADTGQAAEGVTWLTQGRQRRRHVADRAQGWSSKGSRWEIHTQTAKAEDLDTASDSTSGLDASSALAPQQGEEKLYGYVCRPPV